MRTLHVDCLRGFSAAAILAALVDLGVAPSPILHALGALDLPATLRFEEARGHVVVRVEPDEAPMPVPVDGARALLDELAHEGAALAQEAVGLLIVAEVAHERALRGKPLAAHVDARALASVAAAALAVEMLSPDAVQASRIAVPDEPTPALVELLGEWSDHLEFGSLGPVTTDGAALLRALCDVRDVGLAEPEWRAHASRGASGAAPYVRVALGERA